MAITIFEITVKGTLFQGSKTKSVAPGKQDTAAEVTKLMVEDLAKKAKGKNER